MSPNELYDYLFGSMSPGARFADKSAAAQSNIPLKNFNPEEGRYIKENLDPPDRIAPLDADEPWLTRNDWQRQGNPDNIPSGALNDKYRWMNSSGQRQLGGVFSTNPAEWKAYHDYMDILREKNTDTNPFKKDSIENHWGNSKIMYENALKLFPGS